VPTDVAANREPVDTRQHQVENDEVGRLPSNARHDVLAGEHDVDGVPRFLEIHPHELGDVAVVLDDENAAHGASIAVAINPPHACATAAASRAARGSS